MVSDTMKRLVWFDSEGNEVDPPKTNADMIRSMTDEELVDIICCQYKECKDLYGECNKCLLDWLKQEVSGE